MIRQRKLRPAQTQAAPVARGSLRPFTLLPCFALLACCVAVAVFDGACGNSGGVYSISGRVRGQSVNGGDRQAVDKSGLNRVLITGRVVDNATRQQLNPDLTAFDETGGFTIAIDRRDLPDALRRSGPDERAFQRAAADVEAALQVEEDRALAFGRLGTELPPEFLEQEVVKVGGYMPEFGRSVGSPTALGIGGSPLILCPDEFGRDPSVYLNIPTVGGNADQLLRDASSLEQQVKENPLCFNRDQLLQRAADLRRTAGNP